MKTKAWRKVTNAYNFFSHGDIAITGTVEIRYNGLEGTVEFWLLNPNVVKLNFQFLLLFFVKEIEAKSTGQAYMFSKFQGLGICSISKQRQISRCSF